MKLEKQKSLFDRYRCKRCGALSFVNTHTANAIRGCFHHWQICWIFLGPVPLGSVFAWHEEAV